MSTVAVAKEMGCIQGGIFEIFGGQKRSARVDPWTPPPGRFGGADRGEIRTGIQRGDSLRCIARALGRAPSTTSREVAANGGRGTSTYECDDLGLIKLRRAAPPFGVELGVGFVL